jgi:hypothetical protein
MLQPNHGEEVVRQAQSVRISVGISLEMRTFGSEGFAPQGLSKVALVVALPVGLRCGIYGV